jgi:endonuclease III
MPWASAEAVSKEARMGEQIDVLGRLMARHGRTYADELGIGLRGGGRDGLFQLLVGSLLMSARIDTSIAVAAARALFARGYADPAAMLEASWQDRVDALGEGSYVRYDESTATYLAETSQFVLERYDGDLRQLRAAANGDPERVHGQLQEAKGIGRVGADIFCREAQTVWEELRPFADARALEVAAELGLGDTPQSLARLNRDDDLAVVTAALVRARAADDLAVVRDGGDAAPTETQLAIASRAELYQLARQRDVQGRSSMTRDELADALRRDG